MNKFITQKLKPQDNLYTIRQYSSINDPSINERFNNKYSNLHILAAFSNAHIKNEIYYLTASTIQSEFPIKFREGTAAAEALRLLNMDEIYFFNITITLNPAQVIKHKDLATGKIFIFIKISYNEFFSSEHISMIFKESRFEHNNYFFYFARSTWTNITSILMNENIIAGGGANNKKHILAPVESRLAIFAACYIEGSKDRISESLRLSTTRFDTRPQFDYARINTNNRHEFYKSNNISNEINKLLEDQNNLDETNEIRNIKSESESIQFEDKFSPELATHSEINKEEQTTDRDSKTENKNRDPIINFLNNNKKKQAENIFPSKREYHSISHSTQGTANKAKRSSNNHQIRSKSSIGPISRKRSISSNSLMESPNSAIKIEKQSALTFFDRLSEVIKNSHSDPEKAQRFIEKSLFESEQIKLENESFLLTRHSSGLHKLVIDANVTLNILEEKNEIKSKFPFDRGELNKLEYLLLAFSLGVTYNGRLD